MVVVAAAVGCRRGEAASTRGLTIDDHDHRLAVAAVEAMDAVDSGGSHLEMSGERGATSDDSTRADELVVVMRDALRKYEDPQVAVADGFGELSPADGDFGGAHGRLGVVHLVNWPWALEEAVRFNPAKPTALVYRAESGGGRRLVGAMYTAPDGATAAALDRRIPLGVARWHRHVDWCTPKRGDDARWTETARDGRPVFGPGSTIGTAEACDSVAGAFHPHVFGWMVHANLFGSDDPAVIWGGLRPDRPARSAPGGGRPDSAALATAPVAAPGSATGHGAPGTVVPVSRTAMSVADTALPTTPTTTAGRVAPHPPVRATVAREGAAPVLVAAGEPKEVMGSFTSEKVAVSYERFVPRGPGRHPAIVILSASGTTGATGTAATTGAGAGAGDELTAAAGGLARVGYVTEIVHYADRGAAAAGDTGAMRVSFAQWNRTVGDAIGNLASDPAVDSAAIGALGVTQGGRLAMMHADVDPRVRCVVDYFGIFRVEALSRLTRMPPTLLIGIRGSRQFPAGAMRALDARLTALGAPHELQLYQGDGATLAPADAQDAGQRVVRFFEQYLPPR